MKFPPYTLCQPLRGCLTDTLRKRQRQRIGAAVADHLSNTLDLSPLGQQCLRQAQAPVGQILYSGLANDVSKVRGEARTRHAC